MGRAFSIFLVAWLIPAIVFAADPGPILYPGARQLPFNHQGPFLTTGDGGVLCVDGGYAWRSRDEGQSWTQHPLFTDPSRHQVSQERALLRTQAGVVIAAYMNLKEKSFTPGFKWGGSDAEFKQWVLPIYVCRSLDDGQTWEQPILLNKPWCGCIHSLIQIRSGRIVLVGQEIIPAWRHATVVFVSDDQGQTWQRSNVLDIGQGRHDHAGSIEGTIVERKDGSLLQYLRTETGWLYEATSRNGGLLWKDLRSSQIRSVTCCPQLGRLADGRIAMLWNHPPRHQPDSRTSREELSLAFSSDEGTTWSAPLVVAGSYGPGHRVSYPYLYERRAGELWITTMQGGLRMRLDLADLGRGEIPIYKPPVKEPAKVGGVVMFGDSTTAERPGAVKKVYAQRIAEALQGIGSSLSVQNSGVPSNTTRNALARLGKDVLDLRPRVVVIQFGINDAAVDVWKNPPETEPRLPLTEFESNLRSMIDELRKIGAEPILMTTNPTRWTAKLTELYGKPPYRPDQPDGFDAPFLSRYNDVVRKVGSERKVPVVDIHAAFMAKSPDDLLLDGMHPNDAGHALIAELLLPVIRQQLVNPKEKKGCG